MSAKRKTLVKPPSLSVGAVAAMCILVLGGGAHRWLDHLLIASDAVPVVLEHPLNTLPLKLGDWTGTDMPMDERVLQVAGCDDYVSRRYEEASTGQVVDLYVAYAARPAKMLSHRPQVCYPAHGWTPVESRTLALGADEGGFDVLIHRFKRDKPSQERMMVLNYYVLRGAHVTDWTEFWGPGWRLPNLSRDPSFYVAQVQISVRLGKTRDNEAESLLRGFVGMVAPEVDRMLPGITRSRDSVASTLR